MINKALINLIHYSVYHAGPVTSIKVFLEESDDRLSIFFEDNGSWHYTGR